MGRSGHVNEARGLIEPLTAVNHQCSEEHGGYRRSGGAGDGAGAAPLEGGDCRERAADSEEANEPLHDGPPCSRSGLRMVAMTSPARPEATCVVKIATPRRSRLDSYFTGGMIGKKCGLVAILLLISGDDSSRVQQGLSCTHRDWHIIA